MAVEVREARGGSRFELYEDGELAGFAECVPEGEAAAITHTEVDPARGGRGLAGELVRVMLDTLRDRGTPVLPYCSFVAGYIGKHPEYVSLVPQPLRGRFGLPPGTS